MAKKLGTLIAPVMKMDRIEEFDLIPVLVQKSC